MGDDELREDGERVIDREDDEEGAEVKVVIVWM